MAAYYPRRMGTIKELQKAYPDYEIFDEAEEDRQEKVRIAKARGKGPPKKKRTAAGMSQCVRNLRGLRLIMSIESKKFGKRR